MATTAVSAAALRRERIGALAVDSSASSNEGSDDRRPANRREACSSSRGGASPPSTTDRSPDDMRSALEHFRRRSQRGRLATVASAHNTKSVASASGGVRAVSQPSPSPLRNDGVSEMQNLLPTPMRDSRAPRHAAGSAGVDEHAPVPAVSCCGNVSGSDVPKIKSPVKTQPLDANSSRNGTGAIPKRSTTVPARNASPAVRTTRPSGKSTPASARDSGKVLVIPKAMTTTMRCDPLRFTQASKPTVGHQRTSSTTNIRRAAGAGNHGDSAAAANVGSEPATATSTSLVEVQNEKRKLPSEATTPQGRHHTSHGTVTATLLSVDPSPPPRSPRTFYATPSGPSTVSNQSIAYRVEPSEAPRLQSTKFYLDDGTLLMSPDGPHHSSLLHWPAMRHPTDGGESPSSLQPPDAPYDSDSEYHFVDCGSPPPPQAPPASAPGVSAVEATGGGATVKVQPLRLQQVPKLPVSAATRNSSAAAFSSGSSSRTLPRTARDNAPLATGSSRSARTQASSTSAARRTTTPPTTRSGLAAVTRKRTATQLLQAGVKRVRGGSPPAAASVFGQSNVAVVTSPRSWTSTPRTARGVGFREVARPTPAYVHSTDLESAEQERRGEIKGRESATVAIILSHARRERQELLLLQMARLVDEEAHRRCLLARRYQVALFEELAVPGWIEGAHACYRKLLLHEHQVLRGKICESWTSAAENTCMAIRACEAAGCTSLCSSYVSVLGQQGSDAGALAAAVRWTDNSCNLFGRSLTAMTQSTKASVGHPNCDDAEATTETLECRSVVECLPVASTSVEPACNGGSCQSSETVTARQRCSPSPRSNVSAVPQRLQKGELQKPDELVSNGEQPGSVSTCAAAVARSASDAVGQHTAAAGAIVLSPGDTMEFVLFQERQKRLRLSDAFSKQRVFMEECFAAECRGLASSRQEQRVLLTPRHGRAAAQEDSVDYLLPSQRRASMTASSSTSAEAIRSATQSTTDSSAGTSEAADSRPTARCEESELSTRLAALSETSPQQEADRPEVDDRTSALLPPRSTSISRLEKKVARERRHLMQLMELYLSRLRSQCSEEAVKLALSPRRLPREVARPWRAAGGGDMLSASDDDRDQNDVEENNEFATIVLE